MNIITIITVVILSFITSNAFALGTVAEAQIEKRFASKTVNFKENNSFEGHINKRTKLGENLPLNLKDEHEDSTKSTLLLPDEYDAVINKRSTLSENYPS